MYLTGVLVLRTIVPLLSLRTAGKGRHWKCRQRYDIPSWQSYESNGKTEHIVYYPTGGGTGNYSEGRAHAAT